MEVTLMYLTGNDSHLADDLICALSTLFVSFFASEKEEEQHESTLSCSVSQNQAGSSGQGSPDLCPAVNDGPGPVQSGEHTETIRPARKSIITWLARGKDPGDRWRSRDFWLGTVQTARICPARNQFPLGKSAQYSGWRSPALQGLRLTS